MHGSRQKFMIWYMAIQLITQCKNCISSLELHRQLDVSYNTAWLMKHKIMQMMYMEEDGKLRGHIEIDEAELERSPVERCPKSQSFRPFIAALETAPEGNPLCISLSAVKSFDTTNLKTWVEDHVDGACEALCDTEHCFETLCDICRNKMEMLVFPQYTGRRNSPWMKIILSNIKASIYGTFHSINYECYAYRYLADLQYRFNRRFDLKAMFYGLIHSAAQKPHAVFFKPSLFNGKMESVQ